MNTNEENKNSKSIKKNNIKKKQIKKKFFKKCFKEVMNFGSILFSGRLFQISGDLMAVAKSPLDISLDLGNARMAPPKNLSSVM